MQLAQHVEGARGDADVVALAERGGTACVTVMFVRGGRNLGAKAFFPRAPAGASPAEVIEAFLSQYYFDKPVPQEIIVDEAVEEAELLEASLAVQSGHRVEIKAAVRGERARWLEMAAVNARHALELELAKDAATRARLEALAEALGLGSVQRIECFDVSHTQGEATVAGCVVFVGGVAAKREYRRFNVQGVAAGDDYGALAQALARRYTRLKAGEAPLPDVLFVDGGRGQVTAATTALAELGVEGVLLVGIAKGPTRRPGLEQLWVAGREAPVILPPDSPALHLIQQVRDEAHRFAITGMRRRRAKRRRTSPLEEIAGLGPKKRQALLVQFGGLAGLRAAGIEDLMRVRGVSRDLAQRIWQSFHAGETP